MNDLLSNIHDTFVGLVCIKSNAPHMCCAAMLILYSSLALSFCLRASCPLSESEGNSRKHSFYISMKVNLLHVRQIVYALQQPHVTNVPLAPLRCVFVMLVLILLFIFFSRLYSKGVHCMHPADLLLCQTTT